MPEIKGSLRLSGADGRTILRATICLEDTTEADAPSIILARADCGAQSDDASQLGFRLSVPDELLLPGRQYVLSARADVAGGTERKLFGTVQSYPLDLHGQGVTALELRELD